MWLKNPDFDRAICKTANDIAKAIIAEQIPKYKIDSVEFETLTFGSLPPPFQGNVLLTYYGFRELVFDSFGFSYVLVVPIPH
ncbi:hypothetical protein L6452_08529 [Arctium lappa]|uniref:Uncharacterized protein n=1 Tax=Arctium lappa TaxID=4217 RepID=A0ACB9DHR0_ARCLA|nr:hypothetical protein L6452_08529 [Arctium lappa]